MWTWFRKTPAQQPQPPPVSLAAIRQIGARPHSPHPALLFGLPIVVSELEPATQVAFFHPFPWAKVDVATLLSELPGGVSCLLVSVPLAHKKLSAVAGSAMLLRGYRRIEGAPDSHAQAYVVWGFWAMP
jgi:hypothetical protein